MSGFHIEMGGFLYAAAIDARQRRHDMAAGASPRDDLLPKSCHNRSLRLFVPLATPCPAPSC